MKTKGTLCLLAAALLTMSACGAKTPEPSSTSDASTNAPVMTAAATAPVAESTAATEPVLSLEAPTETTSAAQAETEAQTAPATEPAEQTTAAALAPQTKAEILQLYNQAVTAAAARKAGFTKQRSTNTTYYHDSLALKPFKSYVVKFMGLDQTITDSVTAAEAHYDRYLQKASLTEADITSAQFTPDASGGGTIRLTVKPGSSSIDGGKDSRLTAPIDRSGIAVGSGDREEWDHKTAQNAYAAIKDTYAGVKVEESYSNAVITAKVNADGTLTALNVDFDLTFAISKILASRGDAQAHTAIRCSKFK